MPGERCCQRARGDALQLLPSQRWEGGDAAAAERGSGRSPVPLWQVPPTPRCRAGGRMLSSGGRAAPTPTRSLRRRTQADEAQPGPEAPQGEQRGSHSWGRSGSGLPGEQGGLPPIGSRCPPHPHRLQHPTAAAARGELAPARRERTGSTQLPPPKPQLPQRALPQPARSSGFTPSSSPAGMRAHGQGGSNSCCSYNDP